VELGAVITLATEAVGSLIKERRHQLDVTLPPGTLYLEADPVRLQQILINLLNNAAKYTEPGGRIELILEHAEAEAVVRVRDTGIGLPADHLEHIFDPFVQIGRTHSSSVQWGLGIGLTLVRSLVALHGGSVEATSGGANQGSEFIVRLPLLTPSASPKLQEPTPTAAGERRRLRVLIVDDNVDAVTSMARVLETQGHEVRTAHDGTAAMESAQAHHPEVVLLDIGLPGIDGYEVARRLRGQACFASTLLVALTGFGQEEDRSRSQEAGFDSHLVKPVEPAYLDELLSGFAQRTAV
ncbi:MAG TPA: ATP-binding protein, partial [Gemmataceae bacterium]|nr:ATP-binding protein [Gemmataceae bacterium]